MGDIDIFYGLFRFVSHLGFFEESFAPICREVFQGVRWQSWDGWCGVQSWEDGGVPVGAGAHEVQKKRFGTGGRIIRR